MLVMSTWLVGQACDFRGSSSQGVLCNLGCSSDTLSSTRLLHADMHIRCFACGTVSRPMQAHLQPGLRRVELYLLLSKPGVVLLTHPPLTGCCFLLVAGKQGVGNLASLHLHLLICIFNGVQQWGTVDAHQPSFTMFVLDVQCHHVFTCRMSMLPLMASNGVICVLAVRLHAPLTAHSTISNVLMLLSHHCITAQIAAQSPVWQRDCTCSFALRASICFCKSMNLPGDPPLFLPDVGVCLLLEGLLAGKAVKPMFPLGEGDCLKPGLPFG